MPDGICENCGDATLRRFNKDCARCEKPMLVCLDCMQDHVQVEHAECDYPEDA